ncbi:hypothetical protein Sango_1977200 [Sesamum angolense]|uniref:Reverse transcriptase domain-containing protein n=1 Tax=Sesamum angolense TaxID=2727404 RepID=A0AAE1WEX2_9LAMI|nr:hypothetical protein Sango_1977200 [Sesamum angolense]
MLQQRAKTQWLKGGDQCSKVFFRRVTKRRASMRVFQINDDAGHTITNFDEIVAEFIAFYEQLLGGTRNSRTLDLTQYRPWASRILSHEDGVRLTRPVSIEKIKLAFFDIAEDKSPGPNGHTEAFYKAAWPIVGGEITRAIMDFFTNGQLFKQVNVILLVLIPKVQSPSSVLDFMPISCGNVLYKAITKILVQRLREILDDLISTSHNAFVPGRKIGDNILLAQELFTGYNQQNLPKRCALKKGVARTGYSKVAWSQVCNPVDEGGLGVRDFQSLNLAFMSRRLWEVRFSWLYRDWIVGINWAARRWRGKHIVNTSYQCLLASLTYHVWQEQNHQRFQGIERTAAILGHIIADEWERAPANSIQEL